MRREPAYSILDRLVFSRGAHRYGMDECCALEAYSRALGIRHTDRPECVLDDYADLSFVMLFIRTVNDGLAWKSDEERTEVLRPILHLLPHAPGEEANGRRSELARACTRRLTLAMFHDDEAETREELRTAYAAKSAKRVVDLLYSLFAEDEDERRPFHHARNVELWQTATDFASFLDELRMHPEALPTNYPDIEFARILRAYVNAEPPWW